MLYTDSFDTWKMWTHPKLYATFQLFSDCNHLKKEIHLNSVPSELYQMYNNKSREKKFQKSG